MKHHKIYYHFKFIRKNETIYKAICPTVKTVY